MTPSQVPRTNKARPSGSTQAMALTKRPVRFSSGTSFSFSSSRLVLAASVTTGYTAQAAVEAIKYYSGRVSGIAAIFATVEECAGYPVRAVFNPKDLGDYASYPSHECPICKEGKKIDALVNSHGYSKLQF